MVLKTNLESPRNLEWLLTKNTKLQRLLEMGRMVVFLKENVKLLVE
jgi:hypothetical protein